MTRYIFRFFVITITILTANLLTTAISDYLTTYRNHVKPFTFTLIGMGVIVLVFYPLFTKMETWVKKISSGFIKTSRNVAGKYLGLFLAIVLAMIILFYFYLKLWYGIDLLRVTFSGNLKNYF
ncbi:MAG TPA: hypothetical protein VK213_10885 [Bacteroidales bacterium]|nr:hypothetical protein [Bacteroidales bacterium]